MTAAGAALGLALTLLVGAPPRGLEGGRLVSTVRFGADVAELDATADGVLAAGKAALEEHSKWILYAVGHTDDRGTSASNLALGLVRAKTVRDWMIRNGVPAGSIQAISRGESEPLQAGKSEEDRAANRRVEIWGAPEIAPPDGRPLAWLSWLHREVAA